MTTTMRVDQIKVGKRHRRDLGDLRALARDIDEIGLLQPIVVTPDGELIAGERRLKAWEISEHRHKPIPVHIVDLQSIVRGEASENFHRKDFTPSEMVAIARALEAPLRERALERKRAGAASTITEKGRVTETLGEIIGIGARTLEKAIFVVSAAERNPTAFAHIAAEMDRSGRVDRAYQQARRGGVKRRPTAGARQSSIFDMVLVGGHPIGDIDASTARHLVVLLTAVLDEIGRPRDLRQPFREFVDPTVISRARAAADRSA